MEQILLYMGIAAVAAIVTVILLLVTKTVTFVTVGCGLIVGAIVVLVARIQLGYWDPFAEIAFVANAAFAFVISAVVVAIGKWLRWPLFGSKQQKS